MPFIVFHNLQPLHNHIQGQAFATLISGALIKKNNVMNTMSTHFAGLWDKRTKPFPFAVGISIAASMHEKDEVTFGCSINFKGFYTIKHNLSRGGYYILPSLFLVSLWYFCCTSKILVFLILCINMLVESVRLSTQSVCRSRAKQHFPVISMLWLEAWPLLLLILQHLIIMTIIMSVTINIFHW